MNITKQSFINWNKWMLYVAVPVYQIGLFTPVKYIQPGLIFVFGAAFFCLLHRGFDLMALAKLTRAEAAEGVSRESWEAK